MKRLFDFSLALLLILLTSPLLILIYILVRLTSEGPVLFWSSRVGINSELFEMPKFRTMYLNAPVVATHLLGDSSSYVTTIGSLLRKSSLDELPQLYSILKGDMSFVGPRPALFNQNDLILMRQERLIDSLRPGLTGWAQVNGRDELPIPQKVDLDYYYFQKQSFCLDIRIILLTFYVVLKSKSISH